MCRGEGTLGRWCATRPASLWTQRAASEEQERPASEGRRSKVFACDKLLLQISLARRLLELRQIGKHFGAVFFRVHVEIGFADDAGGIDEEGVAGGGGGGGRRRKREGGGGEVVALVCQQRLSDCCLCA